MDLCSWCLSLLNLGFAAQTSSFGFGKDSQLVLVMPLLQEGNRFTLSHALRKFGRSSDATKSHMFQRVTNSHWSCDVMCEQGSSKLPTLVELECSKFKV